MRYLFLAAFIGIFIAVPALADPGGEGNNTGCNGVGNENSPCAGQGGDGGSGGAGGSITIGDVTIDQTTTLTTGDTNVTLNPTMTTNPVNNQTVTTAGGSASSTTGSLDASNSQSQTVNVNGSNGLGIVFERDRRQC